MKVLRLRYSAGVADFALRPGAVTSLFRSKFLPTTGPSSFSRGLQLRVGIAAARSSTEVPGFYEKGVPLEARRFD